jgi:hypothetical protein
LRLRNQANLASTLQQDVLAYIFRFCVDDSPGAKFRVSHVCQSWRIAAVTDKGLWSNIDLSSPSTALLMLERSSPAPISLRIYPPSVEELMDDSISALEAVLTESRRIRAIDISKGDQRGQVTLYNALERKMQGRDIELPNLEVFSALLPVNIMGGSSPYHMVTTLLCNPCPSLIDLTLRHAVTDWAILTSIPLIKLSINIPMSPLDITSLQWHAAMKHLSHSLEALTLTCSNIPHLPVENTITMHRLRYLSLRTQDITSALDFLERIELPSNAVIATTINGYRPRLEYSRCFSIVQKHWYSGQQDAGPLAISYVNEALIRLAPLSGRGQFEFHRQWKSSEFEELCKDMPDALRKTITRLCVLHKDAKYAPTTPVPFINFILVEYHHAEKWRVLADLFCHITELEVSENSLDGLVEAWSSKTGQNLFSAVDVLRLRGINLRAQRKNRGGKLLRALISRSQAGCQIKEVLMDENCRISTDVWRGMRSYTKILFDGLDITKEGPQDHMQGGYTPLSDSEPASDLDEEYREMNEEEEEEW